MNTSRTVLVTKRVLRQEQSIFRRDDARFLMRTCCRTLAARRARVVAVAFEPKAIHLVLEIPPGVTHQTLLGDLFSFFTRRYNARYRRRGPILRARHLTRPLLDEVAVTEAVARLVALAGDGEIAAQPWHEPTFLGQGVFAGLRGQEGACPS